MTRWVGECRQEVGRYLSPGLSEEVMSQMRLDNKERCPYRDPRRENSRQREQRWP